MPMSPDPNQFDDAELREPEFDDALLGPAASPPSRRFETFGKTENYSASADLLTIDAAKDIADRAVGFHNATDARLTRGLHLLEMGLLQHDPSGLSDGDFLEFVHAAAQLSSAALHLRNGGYDPSGQVLNFRLSESRCVDILREIEDRAQRLPSDQNFRNFMAEQYGEIFSFVSATSAPVYHAEFWLDVIKSDSYLVLPHKNAALINLRQPEQIPLFHAALDIMLSRPGTTNAIAYGVVKDLVCSGMTAFDFTSASHALHPIGLNRLRQVLINNLTPIGQASSYTALLRKVSKETLDLMMYTSVH